MLDTDYPYFPDSTLENGAAPPSKTDVATRQFSLFFHQLLCALCAVWLRLHSGADTLRSKARLGQGQDFSLK